MGKKLTISLLILLFFSITILQAQDFTDDFEGYEVGDYIGPNNDFWETWSSNGEGGSEDVKVVDDLANSGTKSIYFNGANGGGPQDVILQFGGKKTSGEFKFKMMMFVPEGNESYFNFQGNVTPGQEWVMEAFFNTDGSYAIQNSDSEVVFSGAYPADRWYEFAFDINLDANIWNFKLDGECVGSFTNPNNSISSLDLFPTSAVADFWIDDVSYSYTSEAPEVVIDGGLLVIVNDFLGFAGREVTNVGYLVNTGAEQITSASIQVTYDGSIVSKEFTDLALMPGETILIDMENPTLLIEGDSEVLIEITEINGMDSDDETCNNSFKVLAKAVVPAPDRVVVVEEATGTWCQFCPSGAVFMERFSEKYGDNFVGIAIHNTVPDYPDPMYLSNYDSGITSFPGFAAFPSVISERQEVNSVERVERPLLDRFGIAPSGTFDISATLNEDTRELDFSVRLKAVEDISTDYNLVVALVEDEVTGSGEGWAQQNAYSGGGLGPMGGYEDLPNPVPGSQMVYQDVARALLTAFGGDDFSDNIAAGGDETMNFSYTIPGDYDIEHMSIATILIGSDGTVDNAKEVSIQEALDFESITIDPVLQTGFNVFPNPVGTLMNVKIESPDAANVKLEIYNMQGQLVQTETKSGFSGQQHWLVNVSSLQDGMYVVSATIGDKTATQKIEKITK